MEHDDDVGAVPECLDIAGFLVGAISGVVGMRDDHQVQGHRESRSAVATAVVDQDDRVDNARRDVRERRLERLRRVVRGHHHYGSQRLDRTSTGFATHALLLSRVWQLRPSLAAGNNAVFARLTSFRDGSYRIRRLVIALLELPELTGLEQTPPLVVLHKPG